MSSFLSKPPGELLKALAAVIKMCLGHLLEYKIDAESVEKLQGLHEKASLAYAASEDPMTRNKLTTKNKNKAFKELKTYASKFIDMLVLNENIPNEVLTTLGIRSREHHREPEPAPVEQGYVEIKKVGTKHRGSLNQKTDNQTKDSTVAKHATGGTEWESQIGDGPIIPERSSSSTLWVDTPEEMKGKPLKMRARWVNAKYEPGPWSEWVEIFIN